MGRLARKGKKKEMNGVKDENMKEKKPTLYRNSYREGREAGVVGGIGLGLAKRRE